MVMASISKCMKLLQNTIYDASHVEFIKGLSCAILY